MSTYRSRTHFSHVPNAFVEAAPATLVGVFYYAFDGDNQDPIYVRPGAQDQQDLLDPDGAEWLLYTRSVMSYRININSLENPDGGASLVVELGDTEAGAVAVMRDCLVFHLVDGLDLSSSSSGIELPALMARFRIMTANPDDVLLVGGSIIVRSF